MLLFKFFFMKSVWATAPPGTNNSAATCHLHYSIVRMGGFLLPPSTFELVEFAKVGILQDFGVKVRMSGKTKDEQTELSPTCLDNLR